MLFIKSRFGGHVQRNQGQTDGHETDMEFESRQFDDIDKGSADEDIEELREMLT